MALPRDKEVYIQNYHRDNSHDLCLFDAKPFVGWFCDQHSEVEN